MKKLAVAGLVVGILSASCSGHGLTSAVPAVGSAANPPSTMGAHTTRPQSLTAAPSGWATTATQAVSLANATDLGPMPSSQTMTVRLGLQMRNADALKAAVAGAQIVPFSAFMTTYAPTADQVAQVVSYLQSQGFTNVQAEPNNLLVDADGSAAAVQKAFNTTLHSFSQNGVTVHANVSPAYVPTKLAGIVIAVLGLNSAQIAKAGPKKGGQVAAAPTPAPTASPSPRPCIKNTNGTTGTAVCPRYYDPPTFSITYDAGNTPSGGNTNVAIMTEGQLSGAISDFRWNERMFNLPQVPIKTVQVQPMSSDTSGNDEWTLDMTYSTGMAYKVKTLYLYNFASLSDSDIIAAYNRWTTDHVAQIANSSFGGCEVFPYVTGAMLVADEILVEAAAQGQTMFASTGDTGAYCGVAGVPPNGAPGGLPFVEWPAASPYVVAVGGTDLFSNADGTYLGETPWEAGGGGISQFEYSPYWQQGVQPIGTTPVGYSFRGLPDVSYDASIETAATLYTSSSAVNGSCTPCTAAGTSLSSPMAAGVYARFQSAHSNMLGFAAPHLYNIYKNNAPSETNAGPPPTQLIGGYHDILTGSNGGYTAAPKYDYASGMGSMDIARTNALIAH